MSDKRLEIMRELGFPSYPARVYIALCDHGPLAARPLAEVGGVPVGKVYSALRYLADRHLVEERAGRPQTYAAARLERYVGSLRASFSKAIAAFDGEARREVPAHLLPVLERMRQPAIVARVGGPIEACNPACTKLFGYGAEEMRYLPLEALFAPGDRAHLRRALERGAEAGPSGTRTSIEALGLERRGQTFPSRIDLVPLPGEEDASDLVVALVDALMPHAPGPATEHPRAGGFAVVHAGKLVHFDKGLLRLLGHGGEPDMRAPSTPPASAAEEVVRALARLLPEGARVPEQAAGTIVTSKGKPILVELAVRPAALPVGAMAVFVRESVAR